MDLTINNSSSSTDVQQACDSYTWIDGINYTASNNSATFLSQTVNGCDSLVTLDLIINNSSASTDTKIACDSYTWIDGINYTQSNTVATYIIPNGNINGCDSIITLDLTINNSSSSTDVQQACDSYTWIDGINYTQSNTVATYIIPNGNINGCDSIITLDLTINNSSSSTDVQQACDSYIWIDGINYTQSNTVATYIIPNGNINGCDSIITLDLTINNSSSSTDVQQACDSYIWIDGINYTASNNSATFLSQTVNGCDSLVTLDLTINNSSASTDTKIACDSYTWIDGINYTASNNSATFLSQTVNGCDSLVTLDLTINNSSASTDTKIACDSYTWIDGINYTASNNSATFLSQTVNGCDSLVTLDLTINNSSASTDTKIACDSYTWIDGINYTQSNTVATYIIPNGNINGCDSIITLDLTINNSSSSTDVQQACDSYTWIDGINYTQSNTVATYIIPNGNINGCDSIITLDLTINNSSSSTDVQQACDSYTWIDGINYTASNNSATFLSQTVNGCDSLVTLDLTINNSSASTDTKIACDSYTWIDGINYTASNNSATFLSQTVNGCDSLVTLDLTINNSSASTDTKIACDSYTWIDGINYTQSNTVATYIIPNGNINGCDSIITLDLTINNSSSSTDVQQACDSYTWIDGINYTQSNTVATYIIPNGNINGCDSIITLDLTINNSSSSTDVQQACDSYTWIDGINYTASNNSATFLSQTVNGCDSLVTLDLTINNSSASTDTKIACDSYTWIDGINYTQSNTVATYIIPNGNINGCDSLVTLDLIINNSSASTDTKIACDSYTWIDGINYTQSNTVATYIIPNGNINGCDSIITLDLTINNSSSSTDVQQACDSYTWIDGINYTASNNSATFLSQTVNGCDSLVTLDLTINDLPTAIISGTITMCEDEFTPITFTLQNGLPPYNVNYNINGVATSNSFSNSGINTIMVSPSTTTVYSLVDIMDANNCFNTASDSATIDVNEKVNVTINGGGDICNDGSQVTIDIITNDSTFINVTYTNGFNPITLSGVGPFEIITNQAGIYMITDVVDIYGCVGIYSGNATITVNPLPLAEFSFFPQPTDLDNPHINFTNASFGHTTAIWDFGDGTILNDTISKLLHTYNDTGHYKVNLAISNPFGCTDTISYTIIIDPIFTIYIPDAFTPNGDNINDAFGPSVYGIKEFEMKIYDRWGKIIYHTTEKDKPWDGTINNNETQAGVYTYSIVATDLKEKPHKYVGAFILIR